MTVKLGDRAIYYPRVPYGRQSELFCFVTRIVDAERGIVDIVTFPAAGEFQHINNVMPKGEGIQIHCWAPREEDERIAELEGRIKNLETWSRLERANQQSIQSAQDELQAAQSENESGESQVKRGPGRPRKDAA